MLCGTDLIVVCAREPLVRGIRCGRRHLDRVENMLPSEKMVSERTFQSSNFLLVNFDLLSQLLDNSFQPFFLFVGELDVGGAYFEALHREVRFEYANVQVSTLFSEFCVAHRVFSCMPHRSLCIRLDTHQAARPIRRSTQVLAHMRVLSTGIMSLVTHHRDRHLPWYLVYLNRCALYSSSRTCSANKRSFLSKF